MQISNNTLDYFCSISSKKGKRPPLGLLCLPLAVVEEDDEEEKDESPLPFLSFPIKVLLLMGIASEADDPDEADEKRKR